MHVFLNGSASLWEQSMLTGLTFHGNHFEDKLTSHFYRGVTDDWTQLRHDVACVLGGLTVLLYEHTKLPVRNHTLWEMLG